MFILRCSVGVVSGLRQLLEFGLFHGDPHPGNIFCLRDGRIAYVDFGNVAQLSNSNKQVRWQPPNQAAALLDHFRAADGPCLCMSGCNLVKYHAEVVLCWCQTTHQLSGELSATRTHQPCSKGSAGLCTLYMSQPVSLG